MLDAVICSPLRTPVGRFGGALRDVPAQTLGATVVAALVERTGIDPDDIDDVVFGHCYGTSEAPAIGRVVALDAGLPVSVPGLHIDRRCGSALQAVLYAAALVQTGAARAIVAGGAESMSQAVYYSTTARWGARAGDSTLVDALSRGRTTAGGRLHPVPGGMLETAENLRRQYSIPRQEQDELAFASHRRAVDAQARGAYAEEIVPVTVTSKRGDTVIDSDEHPRPDISLEALGKLTPVMQRHDAESTVTAGNASGQNDGAAACLVTTREYAEQRGLRPLARGRQRRGRGCGAEGHGHRPGGGERACACRCRADAGRHGPDRAQRGFRRAGAGRHARVGVRRGRLRASQRQRVRHLVGPSGRRHGRSHTRHAAARDGPPRFEVRPRDAVHRRRTGHRRRARAAAGLSATMRLDAAIPVPAEVRARYVAAGWWGQGALRDGIEAAAQRVPDRLAVVDATTSWTYALLEHGIATAVAGLRAHGITAGDAVLVVAPLTVEAAAVYSAVIRCGATAVMLDRRAGRVDLDHALRQTAPRLVTTTPALADRLGVTTLGLPSPTFADLLGGDRADRDWAEPTRDTASAVVFTSGTTSRPKGVAHCLDTLTSGARNMAASLDFDEHDAAFLSTPLASITGLVQLHLTLDRHARLVLEDRFDPAGSLARLRASGATILGGAPIIVEELFRRAEAEDLAELPLRAICLGGTMIPRPVLEIAIDRYGIEPARIYGSSEVPCATTTRPAEPREVRLADDGRCADGTELRTLDGPNGELLVRGPMRLLGYLDAEDNAEAFTSGGWYRTGDLGRVEHGRLRVTGRLKEIVARKGMKISLAEIDDVARVVPGVVAAAAYGVPDPDTGERLVLAVHAPGTEITLHAVTDALLAAGLAKWKLPEQLVLWDDPLPRTASGKVQRTRLADGAAGRPALLAPRLQPPRL